MPYKHPMLSVQRKLEAEAAQATSDKFYAELAEAKQTGRMEYTKPGRHILATTVLPVADILDGMINKRSRGQPPVAVRLVKEHDIDLQVAAYLTVRQLLEVSSQSKLPLLTQAAGKLGQEVYLECQFKQFERQHKTEAKQLEKQWEKRGTVNPETRKAQIRAKARHVAFELDKLGQVEAVHLGSMCFEAAAEAGLAEFINVGESDKTQRHANPWMVTISQQLLDHLGDLTDRAALLQPRYWPMVCPPRPWSHLGSGGYRTNATRQLSFVKHPSKEHMEALEDGDLSQVMAAINAIQATPWRVNPQVLEVFEWAVSQPHGIGGLPPAEDLALPPKPPRFDELHAADPADPVVLDWKRKAARVHEANVTLRSKRLQALTILEVARKFSRFESIYFPHVLDFRGRAYAVPMFLNPQGADPAKGLLTFSKGERMGDHPEAEHWLAVHGANVYGEDKCSMDDRALWTHLNDERICATAKAPLDMLDFWTEADKPWQFLAFCFEWAGYREAGPDFVTTLPVAMDGSCNGLQHYSAILRDEVGGAEVNLLPSPKPRDIYSTVAEKMMDLIAKMDAPDLDSFPVDPETGLVGPLDDKAAADYVRAKLKTIPITRKITKRTVMTVPYGVTHHGAQDQVRESLGDAFEGQTSPFQHLHLWSDSGKVTENPGFWTASYVMGPILMDAIGEALTGANECMDFIRDCTKLASASGKYARWTTPDGFPVLQRYCATKPMQVRTMVRGGIALKGPAVQLKLQAEQDKVDRRKSASAAPPNFIHSMDATAMRLYVRRAKEEGIRHFALVHDSYGTLATRVPDMNRLLRDAFVELYQDHDVLADFKASMMAQVEPEVADEFPDQPQAGQLDLDKVRESVYFFS